MSNKCKCTMAQSLAGDGCDECNPKLALEYAKETIRNLEEDAEAQAETINELMAERDKFYEDVMTAIMARVSSNTKTNTALELLGYDVTRLKNDK